MVYYIQDEIGTTLTKCNANVTLENPAKKTKGNSKMKNVAYIISNSGNINMVLDGTAYAIGSDHVNYKAIANALKEGRHEDILGLIDIPAAIAVASAGVVEVVDGEVLYHGEPLHNCMTDRILNLMREELPFQFMVNFLDNLMQNPSHRAVQELYGFLEAGNLPITEDGHFLAYKRVRGDYTDLHSGKFDNSIGSKPSMPRNEVDEDKDRTCSNGLHFCSLDYLPSFGSGGGNVIVIVKINPKDVVAIPSDYNNTKGRCSGYEVIGEHKGDDRTEAFKKSVYTSDGQPYGGDDADEDYDDDYDSDGYDQDGYDADGYSEDGYANDGYDRDGYDESGYDDCGYDQEGYDADGYNEVGLNRNRERRNASRRDPSTGQFVKKSTGPSRDSNGRFSKK